MEVLLSARTRGRKAGRKTCAALGSGGAAAGAPGAGPAEMRKG